MYNVQLWKTAGNYRTYGSSLSWYRWLVWEYLAITLFASLHSHGYVLECNMTHCRSYFHLKLLHSRAAPTTLTTCRKNEIYKLKELKQSWTSVQESVKSWPKYFQEMLRSQIYSDLLSMCSFFGVLSNYQEPQEKTQRCEVIQPFLQGKEL